MDKQDLLEAMNYLDPALVEAADAPAGGMVGAEATVGAVAVRVRGWEPRRYARDTSSMTASPRAIPPSTRRRWTAEVLWAASVIVFLQADATFQVTLGKGQPSEIGAEAEPQDGVGRHKPVEGVHRRSFFVHAARSSPLSFFSNSRSRRSARRIWL